MNNRGQVIFFTFMLALTVIVLALGLAFPVKETIDNATNSSNNSQATDPSGTLNCNNSTLSNFDKGACVVADMSMFYFLGGLIFIAGSILAARILL